MNLLGNYFLHLPVMLHFSDCVTIPCCRKYVVKSATFGRIRVFVIEVGSQF